MADEATRKDPKDYEVGKYRPPVETRFKPGQSGFPSGRPKGTKNLKTLIRNEMNEKIAVTENGKRRTITKMEAIIKQLFNKSVQGDVKALQQVIRMITENGIQPPEPPTPIVRRKTFTLRVFEKDISGQRFEVYPGTNRRVTGEPVVGNEDSVELPPNREPD